MDKVIVQVIGLQRDAVGEENRIEMVSVGKHCYKNGIHYILYDDNVDNCTEKTTTLLKIGTDSVTLVRKGNVMQEQHFAESVRSASVYMTPYGKLQLSVLTHKLNIAYAILSGSVDIDYALAIDGIWQSDNKLHIKICAQQSPSIHLN